uniref:E4 protein n=1 Tax=Human papillomavirus TaxID=10566 RepID=A0A385PQQ4_9PAPI|nr:MAG: E4 protein [Human papillomavirus]
MMIKTMPFLTLTGPTFITKTLKINGTKQKERLTMMVYITLNTMVVKVTFYYFMKIPSDIVRTMSGVYIIKMNTFISLLPVLLGGLVTAPHHRPLRTPPGTPRLTRRLTDEDRHKQRRAALGLPRDSSNQRSDDDDDEKENQQPVNGGEDLVEDLVSRLLTKWGEAIDQLLEQISQDLNSFKRRLGIRS